MHLALAGQDELPAPCVDDGTVALQAAEAQQAGQICPVALDDRRTDLMDVRYASFVRESQGTDHVPLGCLLASAYSRNSKRFWALVLSDREPGASRGLCLLQCQVEADQIGPSSNVDDPTDASWQLSVGQEDRLFHWPPWECVLSESVHRSR